jgi:hypothetical protein
MPFSLLTSIDSASAIRSAFFTGIISSPLGGLLSDASVGALLAGERKRIKFALPSSQKDTSVCLSIIEYRVTDEISPSV